MVGVSNKEMFMFILGVSIGLLFFVLSKSMSSRSTPPLQNLEQHKPTNTSHDTQPDAQRMGDMIRATTDQFADYSKRIEDIAQVSHDLNRMSTNRSSKNNPSDRFKNWNKTAFLSFRKRVTDVFNISENLRIYDRDVKAEHMLFTNLTTNLNRTHTMVPQGTCAVIGAAGILLNSNCGKEIDSHDFVLRANLPTIRGFENDVGRKENITTINVEGTLRFARQFLSKSAKMKSERDAAIERLKGVNILWHPCPKGLYSWRRFKQIVGQVQNLDLHIQVGYSQGATLNDLTTRFWHFPMPSTGIKLFTAAVTFCDKISLYGFWPFYMDRHNNSLPHHYYEEIKFNYTSNKHPMPREFNEYVKLNKQGVIRLVTETCVNGI